MSLTIIITLEDDDVECFIGKYNEDAGTFITSDMLNQNRNLHEAIAEDMISSWFRSFSGEENLSAYDLYNDFMFQEEVVLLPVDDRQSDDDTFLDHNEY